MADELYALSGTDVEVLRELVNAFRRGDLGRTLPKTRRQLDVPLIYAGQSGSTGIAAATTAGLAGSALVALVTISTSGLMSATTEKVRVYNMSSEAISANQWIQFKREAMTGRLVADFENCT